MPQAVRLIQKTLVQADFDAACAISPATALEGELLDASPAFSRTEASIRSRTAGFSFRNRRALSRPCPNLSPAKLNQEPDFSTTPCSAAKSKRSPSREIPSP